MARLTGGRPVRGPESHQWRLGLLGGWRLLDGEAPVGMLRRERLLVAFLALHGSRPRGYVAGVLWPEVSETNARASLRQALHAVKVLAPGLVEAGSDSLALAPRVQCDVGVLRQWCDRVAQGADQLSCESAIEALHVLPGPELLIGECEDWVLGERARLQRARLSALNALAVTLVERNQPHHAIAACERAADIEPLEEGTAQTLVTLHLSLGHRVDAVRAYQAFRRRVWDELQAEPSPKMTALLT